MVETDMSRSLTAVGREFQFLIDFIDNDINMEITLANKTQYAADLKFHLSKYKEVHKVLIDEHRNMHREYINTRWLDPFVYKVSDYVQDCYQIKSNKEKLAVGKLRFQQRGRWEIISIQPGGSYESIHCHTHNTKDKKKAQNCHPIP